MGMRRGQTLLEYVILVGIVTIVLFAMNPAIKRGYQSLIRVAADQIGNQENADQSFDERSGYLVESNIGTNADMRTKTEEFLYRTTISVDDRIETTTNAITNLGFTEDR